MKIWIDTFHAINMFKQLRLYISMHRVKYKINTLSACKFSGRYEIGISRE